MSRQQLEMELSEYEMIRMKNMEENKAVLAKLMADLAGMKGLPIRAPQQPKPKPKKRQSDSAFVIRRNPARSSRRFTPLGPPPMTRSRRGSVSSVDSGSSSVDSGSSSADSSPSKEGGQLVVRFGAFFKPRKTLDRELEDDVTVVQRAPRTYRDVRRPEDITEEDVDMVADSTSEKSYDSYYGSSCHQCRQKTIDQKTICRSESCFGLRGQFCGPCLRNRYGEDAKEALKDPEWLCPPCRGICNCSFCRKKAGKGCTGILIHLARQQGHNDVNAYLQSLMKK